MDTNKYHTHPQVDISCTHPQVNQIQPYEQHHPLPHQVGPQIPIQNQLQHPEEKNQQKQILDINQSNKGIYFEEQDEENNEVVCPHIEQEKEPNQNQQNDQIEEQKAQDQKQEEEDQNILNDILTLQQIDIKQYCTYINRYKERRLMRYKHEYDIGVATLAEIVFYCYQEKFITEEMMAKIPHLKLRNMISFINKFNKKQLEAADFTESMFTPFDYRRLIQLLLNQGKVRKYIRGQRLYTIPIEVHAFICYLYSFTEAEYYQLCDQFAQKYNLNWWGLIGEDCEEKVKKQKEEMERLKREQEEKNRPRPLKKKNKQKIKQNNNSTKVKGNKEQEENSSESQFEEEDSGSIDDQKVNDIKNLVTGKKEAQNNQLQSSIFNSDMALDSSLSYSAAKLNPRNDSDESQLLSGFNDKQEKKETSQVQKKVAKEKVKKTASKSKQKNTKNKGKCSNKKKKVQEPKLEESENEFQGSSDSYFSEKSPSNKHDIFHQFQNKKTTGPARNLRTRKPRNSYNIESAEQSSVDEGKRTRKEALGEQSSEINRQKIPMDSGSDDASEKEPKPRTRRSLRKKA